MKKILLFYTLFFLPCIKIFTMELATTQSATITFSSELDSHQKKLDWINEKDQKLAITALLGLQRSKLLNDDLCKTIAHKIFILHTEEEYKNLEKICPLKLGNQEYNIEEMALMSYSHRKQLIDTVHPNFLSHILEGYDYTTISECDYKKLQEILSDDRKNNLKIKIVPSNFCTHLPKAIGILWTATGFGLGVASIITSNVALLFTAFGVSITGPVVTIASQSLLNKNRTINSEEYINLIT